MALRVCRAVSSPYCFPLFVCHALYRMSTEGAPSESDKVRQLEMENTELRAHSHALYIMTEEASLEQKLKVENAELRAQVDKLRKDVSEQQRQLKKQERHEEALSASLMDAQRRLGDAMLLLAANEASASSGSPNSDPSSIPKRCPSSPVYEHMGGDRGEWIVLDSDSEPEKSPSDVKSSKGVCVEGAGGSC